MGSSTAVAGFYQTALSTASRPALICPDDRIVTFAELGDRVNRLSNALRSLGLGVGDIVAALVRNGAEYFELTLATGQVGMYFVPINWHLDPIEVAYIVRDSGASVIVAEPDLAAGLAGHLQDLPVRRFAVGESVTGWQSYDQLDGGPDLPADRTAGLTMRYTSGTSGRPKGVKSRLSGASPETCPITAGLVGFVRSFNPASEHGTHLAVAPMYHSAPGGFAFANLWSGDTVLLRDRFDAEQTLRDIDNHQVTTGHLVPTHFIRLLRLPREVRQSHRLSSLQSVVHAGAPCPVVVKQHMIDWLGPIVWEYLGSTEGLVSIVSPTQWLAKPGTVGKPPAGITVKILDEAGRELPPGDEGTIYFSTGGRPFEYHNDAQKTAASRRHGLTTAGDVGVFDDDGDLFLLDRRTDLIISGGVNIYPAEIEQHLVTHPAVADVGVIGLPDAEWGRKVVAIVLPEPSATAGEQLAEELIAHCATGLASFKRPQQIEFVTEFPRTEAGKVQRHRLRDAFITVGESPPSPQMSGAGPRARHNEKKAVR
jgi:long-chain acyl-CoA synthetase